VSDLDQAVRDSLAKTEDFDVLFDALIAVVDEHMEHGDSCNTMRTIASSLCLDLPPVSSQDTPPPPRQARVWLATVTTTPAEPHDARVVRDVEDDEWGLDNDGLWHSDGAARGWPWAELVVEFGPLTEVPSVSTDPDGRDR
jgi:hypothetical protein